MSMRRLVCIGLFASLALFTFAAHADPWSSGCLVGPMDSYNRCTITGTPAAVLGAIAAPIMVAGAVVTIADELNKAHQELPPGTVSQPNKKPSLSYVPPVPEDPYLNQPERPTTPSPAFNFNDKAANVATAVTAAAVVGAIIGTIAADAGKKGATKH
jgi:hypothetical protein